MIRRTRSLIVLASVFGVILLGLAPSAHAAGVGGSLPAGSSVCNDQSRSDNGVSLSGTVTTPGARVTWTVATADSAGGTETQIFRSMNSSVTGVNVPAPHSGTLFYRLCLANTTRSSVSSSPISTSPRQGATNGLNGIGPTTAVLGPNGTVCGERIAKSGRLTASSNVAITWFVRAFNGDLSIIRSIRPLTVSSTSVNQVVGPGAYAFLDVCAINHSTTQTATLSMQFSSV